MKREQLLKYKVFAKEVIKHDVTNTEAIKRAKINTTAPAQYANQLLKRPLIQKLMDEARESANIGDNELKSSIREWIDLRDTCLQNNDRTNACRCQEAITKIKGHYERDNRQSQDLTIVINGQKSETGHTPKLKTG